MLVALGLGSTGTKLVVMVYKTTTSGSEIAYSVFQSRHDLTWLRS